MNLLDLLRHEAPLSLDGLTAGVALFWPVIGAEILAVGSRYRGTTRRGSVAEALWPLLQGRLLLPILLWGLISTRSLSRAVWYASVSHGPSWEELLTSLALSMFHGGLLLATVMSLRTVWLSPRGLLAAHTGLTGVHRITFQIVLTSVVFLQVLILLILTRL